MEEINFPAHALPTDFQAGQVVGRRKHFQNGQRVGGRGSGNPLLPVVQAVAVGVGEIRRAVRGQTVLLRPGVGENGRRRLILIRADVHRAASDAWVAVEVGAGGDVGLFPALMQGEFDWR